MNGKGQSIEEERFSFKEELKWSPPAKTARSEDISVIVKRSFSHDEKFSSRHSNRDMGPFKSEDKIINDCIHGTVMLPTLVTKIMDTAQFQRLKKILQTGTCHFVYPNATHNRFQHSIGVAHLAQKFAQHLQRQYPTFLDDKDVLCVMIAGLCHDLGHGPYSHLWESFLKEAEPDTEYEHEHTSIRMLDRLLEENEESLRPYLDEAGITDKDIIFIKELIVGPLDPNTGLPSSKLSANDEVWPYKGRSEEKSFLYEIVANKLTGIDVDKWDYFLRDDYYLKIRHVFDHNRFVQFTKIEKTGNPVRRRLVMRDKEAENLLDLFRDRKRLHLHGYQHRISKICDRMLLDAWVLANPHILVRGTNGRRMTMSQASLIDVKAHEQLTDEFVEAVIMISDDERLIPAQEIISRLRRRDLYKSVMEIDLINDPQLKYFTKEQIMKSIEDFLAHKGKNQILNVFDITVVSKRYSLAKSSKTEFYFYDVQGNVSVTDASSIFDEMEHHTAYILCKRKELLEEARHVINKWKNCLM